MTNTTLARTRTGQAEQTGVDVSKGALAAAGVVSAVIGLWAAASFVSGMVASGGPIALARAWFSAVIGM